MHPTPTEDIWDDFHQRLLAFVRGRVRSEQDAEDVLQDVFARIHASAHRLDDVENLSAWVFRIARNAITDHYRAQNRTDNAVNQLERLDVAPPAGLDGTPEHATAPEINLAVCMAPLLQQLPEHYAEAIELTELGGLSQREAASKVGISLSGMKARVQRGRARLRGVLLDCCAVQLDGRHRVVDVEPRNGCGCGCEECK